MATLDFTPVSTGPRTATELVTLRAAATALAASGTYQATTNDANCVGYEFVIFRFVYTKGDETTLEIKPEGWDGTLSGSDPVWTPLGYQATQGSGVSELTKDVLQITGTLTVTTRPMSCRGFQRVRCSLKTTGGTPTGTVDVTATAGIRIAGRSA